MLVPVRAGAQQFALDPLFRVIGSRYSSRTNNRRRYLRCHDMLV